MKILQFLDHLIPYETFLNDLSSRIVRQLKADKDDPEFISQRKAYELFWPQECRTMENVRER